VLLKYLINFKSSFNLEVSIDRQMRRLRQEKNHRKSHCWKGLSGLLKICEFIVFKDI